jgi:4-amino-4-deoxy-L-arabinose transferase-like glycosyltransferase
VIVGTLGVLAVYGLSRALFDRRVALAAAFVMVGLPLHIHFSRLGLPHIWDTLFGTLTLMFIARGLKTNRRSDWALAGMSLGLTLEGGRLLFPPVVILWTAVLILTQRKRLREHGHGFLVCALAAVFISAPVYFSIYSLDSSSASRYAESGMSGEYFSGMV